MATVTTELPKGFREIRTEMWKLYRRSHVGAALVESLDFLVASKNLKKKDKDIILNQFDHSIVKFIRTEAPTNVFNISGTLATFRQNKGNEEHFLLKNVDIWKNFEPSEVQDFLSFYRYDFSDLDDEEENSAKKKKKKRSLATKEYERRINLMEKNTVRVHVAFLPELLLRTLNPHKKNFQTFVYQCGLPYEQVTIPTNYNPYREIIFYKRAPKLDNIAKEEPQEDSEDWIKYDLPARLKRSKDYQKLQQASSDTDQKSEPKIPDVNSESNLLPCRRSSSSSFSGSESCKRQNGVKVAQEKKQRSSVIRQLFSESKELAKPFTFGVAWKKDSQSDSSGQIDSGLADVDLPLAVMKKSTNRNEVVDEERLAFMKKSGQRRVMLNGHKRTQ